MEGDQRVQDADGIYRARLKEGRRRYDAGNFFRLDQHIEPAANSCLAEPQSRFRGCRPESRPGATKFTRFELASERVDPKGSRS